MGEENLEVMNTPTTGRSSKARFILIAVLLAAAVIGVLWWHNLQTVISTENAKVTGKIVDVSFRLGGQLNQINVKEGDNVKPGQVLAMLDNAQYKIAVDQAQAALDLANANFARLPFNLESTRAAADKANDGVAAAEAQVKTAQIGLDDAKRALDKNELLYKEGAVSVETLNSYRSAYDRAKAALELNQANLNAARTTLNDSRTQMTAAAQTSSPILEAQQRQAKAAFDSAVFNYENTIMKASMAGTVINIAVQPGENLSAGQTVLTISDLDKTWVTANIEEKKISRVRKGQKVDITIDAYPGKTFKGIVDTVGDASQSTFALISTESSSGNFTKVAQRLSVKIAVKSEGLLLKPGMSAIVKIHTGS
ncbi:MAG TPA: HlyD family secretion protein [Syntrophomonadaceae bacterium]|nr:HlyD family secretion protein [Syntrophomonadaceae bacterium]